MVVKMGHRMGRMVVQRVGRETSQGKMTLAVFVGILCPGNRLRGINHGRSRALVAPGTSIEEQRETRDKSRAGSQWKRAPVSRVPFHP
jgi:hypothetical protein